MKTAMANTHETALPFGMDGGKIQSQHPQGCSNKTLELNPLIPAINDTHIYVLYRIF